MSNSTVFNTTDSPVVVDDVGSSIGGGEWADVDVKSPQVKDALDRGYLVTVSKPKSESQQSEDSEQPSKPKTKVGGKKNEER